VETVAALRAIPGLDVIRPADPEETAGAFAAGLERSDGPTLLSLCRQNVPNLSEIPVDVRRKGVFKGAYIARKETSALEFIILASGSELSVALDAAKQLGDGARVVSVPCMERFDRQDAAYKASVLPKGLPRVAVEAGVTDFWFKYVGLDGAVVGIDTFGESAPAGLLFKHFGFTTENVVATVKSVLH
jgi:transketolase